MTPHMQSIYGYVRIVDGLDCPRNKLRQEIAELINFGHVVPLEQTEEVLGVLIEPAQIQPTHLCAILLLKQVD